MVVHLPRLPPLLLPGLLLLLSLSSPLDADEDPPPPPPPPLPAYPTARYVFNVTRLNGGNPFISQQTNSSQFLYNDYPSWVRPVDRSRRHWSKRRLEEEPPPPPPPPPDPEEPADGLLLQVLEAGTGATKLAYVQRAPLPSGGGGGVGDDGQTLRFAAPDNSSVVMQADGTEENFAVGHPSLVFHDVDSKFYLLYTASQMDPVTRRVQQRLHVASSNTPSVAGTWQRLGPVFRSYPLNSTETEFGTLVLGRSSGNASNASHYLFFSTTAEATGVFRGLQVASTTDFIHYKHLPNFTLMNTRPNPAFDANGIFPGPAPQRLDQDGQLLFLYNGLTLATGSSGQPWQVSVGWSVLDHENPLNVVFRSSTPLLAPRQAWEQDGRVPNSVVLTGLSRVETKDDYWVDHFVGYYAGAEAAIGAVQIKVHCVSSNPSLTSLNAQGGDFDADFAPNLFTYRLSVDQYTDNVNITATSLSLYANMTVDNNDTPRGQPVNIQLITGASKSVTIHLVAEDNKTSLTYIVEIVRAASSANKLDGLTISPGSLDPPFDPKTNEYNVLYDEFTTGVQVTPTVDPELNPSILVNGKPCESGKPSDHIGLSSGANTIITVAVTSQDGGGVTVYRIVATRAPSSDPTLKAIDVKTDKGDTGGVVWLPAYQRTHGRYAVMIENSHPWAKITPHSNAAGQHITLNTKEIKDGADSDQINLDVNLVVVITIAITAQDGKGEMTYVLELARAMVSANTDLSDLVFTGTPNPKQFGILSPAFTPATNEYMTWVKSGKQSAQVTPTALQAVGTTITVGGSDPQAPATPVTSGQMSDKLDISKLENGGAHYDVTTEVTAQDAHSKKSYVIHIAKFPDPPPPEEAHLADLIITQGPLQPPFDRNKFDYTVDIGESTEVQVFPVTLSTNVSILTVNGQHCNSGNSKTYTIDPEQGDTPFNVTVEVLSADKSSDQKYFIAVSRRQSDKTATLTALSISGGAMKPDFDPKVKVYDISYPWQSDNKVTVTATANESSALLTVDQVIVASGKPSDEITVAKDQNLLVTVESEDLRSKSMYTIRTHTDSNAQLKELALSNGCDLDPAFSETVTAYKCSVKFGVTSATVTPTADDQQSDPKPKIQVDGKDVDSGAASEAIALTEKAVDIKVDVTSADGRTKKEYVVTAVVAPADTTLDKLDIAPGSLQPDFSSGTFDYTVDQAIGTKTMKVTPTAKTPDDVDKIEVDGKEVAPGATSGDIDLGATGKTFTVVVTSKAPATSSTYTIKASVAQDATLKDLEVAKGDLDPNFDPGTKEYTLSLGEDDAASWTVTPTANGPGTKITVSGNECDSGKASEVVPLPAGQETDVPIVVLAQDGSTTETYAIKVTVTAPPPPPPPPPAPPLASLSALSLDKGDLSPVFSTDTLEYRVTEESGTAQVAVTATPTDAGSTLKINDKDATAGTASDIDLDTTGKPTLIKIDVTASDQSTEEYTIIAVIDGMDASLTALDCGDSDKIVPDFDPTISAYTLDLPSGTTSMTVTATQSDEAATMTVDDEAAKTGEPTTIDLTKKPKTTVDIAVTASDGTSTDLYTIDVTVAPTPGL
jgi:predicted GH43/DUF377 family glycosyl hydrolase